MNKAVRVIGMSLLLLPLLLGPTLFLAPPQPAEALDVALVICSVAFFSCPANNIVDASLFQFIPGNLLGPNQFIVQPVAYADPLGLATFTGTFVTADSAGKFIYAWGTGTATANNAGMANLYLDVSIRQSYVTAPGTWAFSESLSGSCDVNAIGATSTTAAQGQVNGVNLPVLGFPGDCLVSPFAFAAGPSIQNVGPVTEMVAGAQFLFAPGGFPQTITLPFGDLFPDPSINCNDPNNPQNFITNTCVPTGFTQIPNIPEPSTLALMSGGLSALVLLRRSRSARV